MKKQDTTGTPSVARPVDDTPDVDASGTTPRLRTSRGRIVATPLYREVVAREILARGLGGDKEVERWKHGDYKVDLEPLIGPASAASSTMRHWAQLLKAGMSLPGREHPVGPVVAAPGSGSWLPDFDRSITIDGVTVTSVTNEGSHPPYYVVSGTTPGDVATAGNSASKGIEDGGRGEDPLGDELRRRYHRPCRISRRVVRSPSDLSVGEQALLDGRRHVFLGGTFDGSIVLAPVRGENDREARGCVVRLRPPVSLDVEDPLPDG